MAFMWCGLVFFNAAKAVEISDLENLADQAARSAYARLNQNWQYPPNSETPVSHTASWEERSVITSSQGRTSLVVWKSDQQPHLEDALDEILNERLIMDCSNAARLVRLYMICRMLGKEETLRFVAKEKEQCPDDLCRLMNRLSWAFFEKVEGIEKGGICAFPFANIEKFSYFKQGTSRFNHNHNVVRLLDGTYLGFDPSFFALPKTYDQVEQFLYNQFMNSEDVSEDRRAQHQKYCEVLQKNCPSGEVSEVFKAVREKRQREVGFFKLNMQKVKIFVDER